MYVGLCCSLKRRGGMLGRRRADAVMHGRDNSEREREREKEERGEEIILELA